jgi:hypothetical protein
MNVQEAIAATPPVATTTALILGYPLESWVVVGNLVWVSFLIIDKLPVIFERFGQFAAFLKRVINGRK